jgi:ribosomal protein L29
MYLIFSTFRNRINRNSEELRKALFSLKFEASVSEITAETIHHRFGLS